MHKRSIMDRAKAMLRIDNAWAWITENFEATIDEWFGFRKNNKHVYDLSLSEKGSKTVEQKQNSSRAALIVKASVAGNLLLLNILIGAIFISIRPNDGEFGGSDTLAAEGLQHENGFGGIGGFDNRMLQSHFSVISGSEWAGEKQTLNNKVQNLTADLMVKSQELANAYRLVDQIMSEIKSVSETEVEVRKSSDDAENQASRFEAQLKKARGREFECDMKLFSLKKSSEATEIEIRVSKQKLEDLQPLRSGHCNEQLGKTRGDLHNEIQQAEILSKQKLEILKYLQRVEDVCIKVEQEIQHFTKENEESKKSLFFKPKLWD